MARSDRKLEHLQQTWLFSGLARRELLLVGRASDEVSVPAGKVLVSEGARGREFFLILDGTASVRRGNRKVATLRPGQYFGELSLLDGQPRSATVVADSPMTLMVLGAREFSTIAREVPSVAQKLLATMAARLRESDAKLLRDRP